MRHTGDHHSLGISLLSVAIMSGVLAWTVGWFTPPHAAEFGRAGPGQMVPHPIQIMARIADPSGSMPSGLSSDVPVSSGQGTNIQDASVRGSSVKGGGGQGAFEPFAPPVAISTTILAPVRPPVGNQLRDPGAE